MKGKLAHISMKHTAKEIFVLNDMARQIRTPIERKVKPN